jgi:alkanesulfonate monooxygenase SsuD/methylene tetrahydromethanopterin reductase-like flavin-dependent oxidoreductase (luciferase family)
VLAGAAGTLDQLAPGRFILGLGASSETIVEQWSGIPFRRPLARMRETTTVVRQMLAGERPTLDGRTIRTRGFRLTSPPVGRVPIYLAALMPPMLELAGEIGDGAVLNFFPVEALPRMMEHLAIGARRAGRSLDHYEVVCRFQVCVTDDPASVRRLLRSAFAPYFATTVYNRFVDWCGFHDEARALREGWAARDRAKTEAAVHDEMIDRLAIIGDAADCRAKIAAFVRAGVTTPMISPILPMEWALRATLEAFAPVARRVP